MTTRTRLLDKSIDLIGQNGYSTVSTADLAKAAGVSTARWKQIFPERSIWIHDCYERLFVRRVRQYEELAKSVPAQNRDPDVALRAVLRTVLVGDKADPLFAATYDFFFMARNDESLLRRMRAVQSAADKRITAAVARMLPSGTSAAVRAVVVTHVEAIGATAVSNGLENFDPRTTNLPILRKLLSNG